MHRSPLPATWPEPPTCPSPTCFCPSWNPLQDLLKLEKADAERPRTDSELAEEQARRAGVELRKRGSGMRNRRGRVFEVATAGAVDRVPAPEAEAEAGEEEEDHLYEEVAGLPVRPAPVPSRGSQKSIYGAFYTALPARYLD